MSDASEETARGVPLWLWPNVLALDAPLVAVAWQHLFAEALGMNIRTVDYAVLGLIVWVIYSADRLVDARRLAAPDKASPRHRFYLQNFTAMACLTAVGAALAVFQVLTVLPEIIIQPGLVLAVLVGLYYFHRIFVRGPILAVLPKEVYSGFVFAAGATLLGYAWTSDFGGLFSAEVILFGVLCSMNCLAISVWERDQDNGNDPNTIAQLWPGIARPFPRLAWAVALAAALWATAAFGAASFPLLAAAAGGLALIAALASFADRLRPAALRVLADVALLLPAVACLPITPWASTA